MIIGGEEYLLQHRPYDFADGFQFECTMGYDNFSNVTLRKFGKEPVYSSLMLVFDDGKILRKRNLLYKADEISVELYDAILLVKHLYKKLKISDEELKKHPIIIIPGYYEVDNDFIINELMANGYFAGTTDTSYSILAINLTPCVD